VSFRRLIIGLVVGAAATLAVAPAAAASQLRPDLGMARLKDFSIDTTTISGHKLLRYTARMVNVGTGPLELHGTRPNTSTADMTVTQRIFTTGGGSVVLSTPLVMFYAGDGHNHWHTKDIEGGVLTRLDNGKVVGALAKEGFCFFDNMQYMLTLPGAPQSAAYVEPPACSPDQPNALTTSMGLSVGWGDIYAANLAFQYVDITGLPQGKYLLTASANPNKQAIESDYGNNSVWAKLQINNNSVKVIQTSPGTKP
jgi:Lysyl oxidase